MSHESSSYKFRIECPEGEVSREMRKMMKDRKRLKPGQSLRLKSTGMTKEDFDRAWDEALDAASQE